jgi:hypothetical protein
VEVGRSFGEPEDTLLGHTSLDTGLVQPVHFHMRIEDIGTVHSLAGSRHPSRRYWVPDIGRILQNRELGRSYECLVSRRYVLFAGLLFICVGTSESLLVLCSERPLSIWVFSQGHFGKWRRYVRENLEIYGGMEARA